MSIWKSVWGKKRDARRASQEGRPALEQLEPRVLLSADFAGIEPILAPDAPSSEHAIYVDLNETQEDTQESLLTITVAPDQPRQADEVIESSPAEAEGSVGKGPFGEAPQPVRVGDPLGTEAGTEETISDSSSMEPAMRAH